MVSGNCSYSPTNISHHTHRKVIHECCVQCSVLSVFFFCCFLLFTFIISSIQHLTCQFRMFIDGTVFSHDHDHRLIVDSKVFTYINHSDLAVDIYIPCFPYEEEDGVLNYSKKRSSKSEITQGNGPLWISSNFLLPCMLTSRGVRFLIPSKGLGVHIAYHKFFPTSLLCISSCINSFNTLVAHPFFANQNLSILCCIFMLTCYQINLMHLSVVQALAVIWLTLFNSRTWLSSIILIISNRSFSLLSHFSASFYTIYIKIHS